MQKNVAVNIWYIGGALQDMHSSNDQYMYLPVAFYPQM